MGAGATVGNALASSLDVDKVAFTGGIVTGRKIMCAASSNVKGISLELGGKSPNIIFADADFDTAVDYGLYGMFYNQGEVCSAGSASLWRIPSMTAIWKSSSRAPRRSRSATVLKRA